MSSSSSVAPTAASGLAVEDRKDCRPAEKPSVGTEETTAPTHSVASTIPSYASVEAGDEEDSCSDACLADIGFLIEGSQPSRLQCFEWVLDNEITSVVAAETTTLAGAVRENIDDGETGKERTPQITIRVALQVADDDPGAVQSGHYLWPAASSLAEYMVREMRDSQGGAGADVMSVVELGAGCALASLTALQVWNHTLQCVLVTDHDPGTLARARDNHETTLEQIIMDGSLTDEAMDSAINNLASTPVLFETLEWGKEDQTAACLSVLQEHTAPEQTKFDLVLGSDLIYSLEVVKPLLSTAAKLMSTTTATVDQAVAGDISDVGSLSSFTESCPSRFVLSQSFLYEDATEAEIDRVCQELALSRTILKDDGKGTRIQEFRPRPKD